MGLFDFLNDHNKKKREIDENVNRIEQERKRLSDIINKYGGNSTEQISNNNIAEERFKKIRMGMDVNQLRAIMMGNPKNIVENATNGKIKTKYYYEKSINRLGKDAYDFEVTLEDGKVIGWKDRRNRGTRDI
jgi:hypothetical protein